MKAGGSIFSSVFFSGILALTLLPPTSAQGLTLSWNPSPDPSVVSYRIYRGTRSGVYTDWVNVTGDTRATLSDLNPGETYYLVVTARNAAGLESLPSNEVSTTVPGVMLRLRRLQPGISPSAFSVTSTGTAPSPWVLEASEDLKTWRAIATGTGASVDVPVIVSPVPRMSFRLRSNVSGISLVPRKVDASGYPNSFVINSTRTAPFQWTLEASEDLKAWTPCAAGANSTVNAAVIVSPSPRMFFRLKGQ